MSSLRCRTVRLFAAAEPGGRASSNYASSPPPVHVVCRTPQLFAVAEGIRDALRRDDRSWSVVIVQDDPGEGAAVIAFEGRTVSADLMKGHLAWRSPNGETGAGAEMELCIMDAEMSAELLRDFGSQLFRGSSIPLKMFK